MHGLASSHPGWDPRQAPVTGSQASSVQALPSLHFGVPAHTEEWHTSPWVHGLWSSQEYPSRKSCTWQPPRTHISMVQGFPSLQAPPLLPGVGMQNPFLHTSRFPHWPGGGQKGAPVSVEMQRCSWGLQNEEPHWRPAPQAR